MFLAALYLGSPAHVGGSLITIFVFLLLHVWRKPYLDPVQEHAHARARAHTHNLSHTRTHIHTHTQGLNVYQQLALISSFFTVFGGIMFMLQTAWETTTGEKQDAWGKAVVGFMIMVANALAAGIYPLWRAGGVNLQFIKESISAVPEKLLEIPMVAEIAEIFRCCMTASDQSAAVAAEASSATAAASQRQLPQSTAVTTARAVGPDASPVRPENATAH